MKKLRTLSSIIAGLVAAPAAFAADYGLKATGDAAGLSGGGDLTKYTGVVIGAALALSGTIFLVLMIYGGITYMTAQGDDTKVKKAKDIIKDTIIGVILIGLSYAILNFVFSIFNQG